MERVKRGSRVVAGVWGSLLTMVLFFCVSSPLLASTNSTAHDREYIVDHNIFSPDRQYTPEKQSGSKKVASGPLKLLGITIVGDLREAVISIKGANPPVVVLKEGEEANGCKLVKVTPQDVVVERNGKKEALVFEEKEASSSPQPASGSKAIGNKKEVEKHPKPRHEPSPEKANENPFFKIIEAVRKNAGKKGKEAPPALLPFH